MRNALLCLIAVLLSPVIPAAQQPAARTLVAVFAHPDDEGVAAPVLARYAREGVQVYLFVVTDGAAGGQQTSIASGLELAKVRAEEAQCATDALGIRPPILLGFPDGQLGTYAQDPVRLFKVAQRLQEELQKVRPDALITWGADGGSGHPDHRLVSAVVTQLVRAGAPGVPDRLFYASFPADVMRAANPSRGEPPMLIPQAKHLTTRIAVTPRDLDAAERSLSCHKSQFPADAMTRLAAAGRKAWSSGVLFAPAFASSPQSDLFK